MSSLYREKDYIASPHTIKVLYISPRSINGQTLNIYNRWVYIGFVGVASILINFLFTYEINF